MRVRVNDVNGARALVTAVLRAAALVATVGGIYLILKAVLLGIAVGNPQMTYAVYTGVGENHPLSRGLALIAVGVPLGLLSSRIAGWIVPVPARGCPSCGYASLGAGGRCPECGLSTGPE